MRNFRITFLIVGCLFVFGIYALARIPKQEFPEYTIRQGVVVGVYPGATAEEVEEQLAKPLEQFLMTYKEVKRAKTTSTSQNGMCYVMVELNDDVNDKDEVWSKVKHGLAAFKMQLPAGVAAVVTNDDFGDTSALLITLESDTRSYRELKGYMDDLSDRLRRIESVSNLRPYGVQQEQISVYADPERLAAYGIGEKTLSAALAAQGLTPLGGSVSNAETETPIHIAPSLAGEREVAEQIASESEALDLTVRRCLFDFKVAFHCLIDKADSCFVFNIVGGFIILNKDGINTLIKFKTVRCFGFSYKIFSVEKFFHLVDTC